jgi:membrane protein required for colicin V production
VGVDWFDLILALILVLSAVAGLRSGFARVVIGLIATVAGLLAGFWCYRLVAAKLLPYVSTAAVANVLGFLIIFLAFVIAGAVLASLLGRFFRWIGLSWADHLMGGVAGLVRGALLVAGLSAILIAFVPSPPPAFVRDSRILPYATEAAAALAETAPHELKDAFNHQWTNLKQFWARHEKDRYRLADLKALPAGASPASHKPQ